MPNLITHTIFARKVFENLEDSKYKTWISENKKEYTIGTNGPDFLFFHDLFPLWKKQDRKIANIGSKIHAKNINLFFETAIDVYTKETDETIKKAMAAYICGHYLHWQLDSIMHPYVVYRTGFKEKNSSSYHHRFESMMDTMLLKHYYNTSIKQFKTYEICHRSALSFDVISSIYIPCVKACLNKEISKKEIVESLQTWEKAQRRLYDPYGIKFACVHTIEKLLNQTWLFSGNIVKAKVDTKYDVCNLKKTIWKHPCYGNESSDSVYDLMDYAIKQAKIGTNLLFNALETNDCSALCAFLQNKTYNDGTTDKAERKYKDVIYK